MANLIWKIYRGRELVAATHYAEDAAAVVSNTADGRVKADGRIVWREGHEEKSAGESYDWAANTMNNRRRINDLSRAIRRAS